LPVLVWSSVDRNEHYYALRYALQQEERKKKESHRSIIRKYVAHSKVKAQRGEKQTGENAFPQGFSLSATTGLSFRMYTSHGMVAFSGVWSQRPRQIAKSFQTRKKKTCIIPPANPLTMHVIFSKPRVEVFLHRPCTPPIPWYLERICVAFSFCRLLICHTCLLQRYGGKWGDEVLHLNSRAGIGGNSSWSSGSRH